MENLKLSKTDEEVLNNNKIFFPSNLFEKSNRNQNQITRNQNQITRNQNQITRNQNNTNINKNNTNRFILYKNNNKNMKIFMKFT
jgi:hypothetical protein